MNINSLRNKFDLLHEQIKGSIDTLMIFENKLDDSFPDGQFLIEGYHAPFRFDRIKYGGGIVLCDNFPFAESFLSKLICTKEVAFSLFI